MTLNGRLTSTTSKRMLSVRKFSAILNVTGREMQPRNISDTRPTPENGPDGWSFSIGICSFLKATRLMRLRAAPLSIKMWYSLTLEIVGETSSGSYPAPAMLLGSRRCQTQSEFSPTCGVVLLSVSGPPLQSLSAVS
jgi:hypothetical protein